MKQENLRQENSNNRAGTSIEEIEEIKSRISESFYSKILEARAGIEPANSSFAGCRLTTWPPRHRIRKNRIASSGNYDIAILPAKTIVTSLLPYFAASRLPYFAAAAATPDTV
jgi:hypothetical protein